MLKFVMVIKDRIYGEIKISEPVIQELIKSKPMQRLKGVSQDGAPNYIQPIRTTSRFDHSVGVWYLSRKFNRSIEEQIASLLHDVPHTAFSHVIDFVMENSKHEFHEKFMEEIIFGSEIPSILKKYNVDIEKVLNKHNFPLLENDLPDISVDRWDYFMRDGFCVQMLPHGVIQMFLDNIKEKDNQFYFEDVNTAAMFAVLYMNFSRLIWLDPTSHGAFFLVANAIKIALEEKIISQEDLFLTDAELWQKMSDSKNSRIESYLNRLKPGNEFIYVSKEESEFYGPNKPRTVDPLVLLGGKLKRVSELVVSLKFAFEQYNKEYKYLGVKQVIKNK